MEAKIKEFFQRYETKIILAIGLVLTAIISFEAGVLKGQNFEQKPLVIEKPGECPEKETGPAQASNLDPESKNNSFGANSAAKECAYLGSKNSNKYHLPNCQWAKRIKPENLVCFSSAKDAALKGYQPDKNCIKN